MLWFDITKAGAQAHRSGLTRVSLRLREELGRELGPDFGTAVWHARKRQWLDADARTPIELSGGDRLLTPELFSEEERPGIGAWLEKNGARAAAIFHDAIPLRLPEITWPQSVARHPDYMRLLASFGRVFAVSAASARELSEYWVWTGRTAFPPVQPITLGADGHGRPRVLNVAERWRSHEVLMIGIVEPRKNQDAVLDAVEALAQQGLEAKVAFVGRTNPHFGRATVRRIKDLARAGRQVSYHEALDDRKVAELIDHARFSMSPSRAEGCGLPVLESLWAGLPVLATALSSIEESARGGGCLLVPPDDRAALIEGIRRMLTDDELVRRLQSEACARSLPQWCDTARTILDALAVRTD